MRLMPEPEDEGQPLVVDLDGFAGPLDLLLQLARTQKVDITRISILALAEQYLVFIEDARRMKLELAADYLVMAAWLAYLKSRLLLPKDNHGDDEPPPEELAARLQFRLQRLQAMRDAAAKLMSRNRLGRDVFQRGWPEPVVVDKQTEWGDTLIDLLQAYAQRRQRSVAHRTYEIRRQPVWTLKEARIALERMLGQMDDWGRFDAYLVQYLVEPEKRRSVIASGFTASLELARAAQARGLDARFVATGQTGIMISGRGVAVDAVVCDFAAGAVEQLVLEVADSDLCVVEGQGSIGHAGFSGVALSILHGACPDALILVHHAGRTHHRSPPGNPLPPLEAQWAAYEQAAALLHPARIVGVALNTHDVSAQLVQSERKRIEDRFRVPVVDPLRESCEPLLSAALEC